MSDHAHSIMRANTIKQLLPTYLEEHFNGEPGRASTTYAYLLKKQQHHNNYAKLLTELRIKAQDSNMFDIDKELADEIKKHYVKAEGFLCAAKTLYSNALADQD